MFSPWSWSPRRVYEFLQLEDPEEFAARIRLERLPLRVETYSKERMESEADRQTGRTTLRMAAAAAHALNGHTVVIRSENKALEKCSFETARDMVIRCGGSVTQIRNVNRWSRCDKAEFLKRDFVLVWDSVAL